MAKTKKFEIGKTYWTRSVCDHGCIFTVKVIKRTEKTVTFEEMGSVKRRKIWTYDGEESFSPENYSMAPVFRAGRVEER